MLMITTFIPNFQPWPVFQEKFSLRIYIREIFCNSSTNSGTPNLPRGHQIYQTGTKLTTRTPVSSKIFGLASIRVRATTWGGFGNFRRQLSIWSKVKRMWNHPVFCNKVGVRVGYLTVLDLTVQIISQLAIDMEAHSLNVASSVFVVELAQVWFVTLNRNKFTSETESTTNNCKNYHVTVHTHVQGRIFLLWIDLVLQ